MTHYHSGRQSRARFLVAAAALGLVVSSIAVLVWPTKSRQAQRLLNSIADSLSCPGPATAQQAASLRDLLRAHFAERTTVAIAGPDEINGTFSRDELLESFSELCASVTRFRVELTQISVDIPERGDRAQALADANIEFQYQGGASREHRQVRFTLRWLGSGYQLTSAEVSPRVTNQPEPRP